MVWHSNSLEKILFIFAKQQKFYVLFHREMIRYTDGNIPLAETDLDIIAKSKHEVTKEPILTNQDKNETLLTEREGKNDEGGIKAQLALKLSFTLPASCYATMAIRELLKTSTSVSFLLEPI